MDLQVRGPERVAASNFTNGGGVFLPELDGAFLNARSPYRGGVEGYSSGLIKPNPVEVESFQRQVRRVNQSVHRERPPLSETISHRSEFGQLTIPIRMNTKSLHIAILIKFRGYNYPRGRGLWCRHLARRSGRHRKRCDRCLSMKRAQRCKIEGPSAPTLKSR